MVETEQAQDDNDLFKESMANIPVNSCTSTELSGNGRSNNVLQSSSTQVPVAEKTQKKRKEGKKGKKTKIQAKSAEENMNSDKEKLPGSSDENGKFSGSLRNVIGPKKRYSLVESENISYGNGSGKTLAEVKRNRSHESEDKVNSLSGNVVSSQSRDYLLTDEMSDNIKQFKGHTSSEMRESISRKKKFCIILWNCVTKILLSL